MKLLFSIQKQIHTFQVEDEIFQPDLTVLKASLSRFFESSPTFVVLDLSQASLQLSDTELQMALLEIKTDAQSKNINLVIAQSDIESNLASQSVLEIALSKRAQILENKLELREKMKLDAVRMLEENEKMKLELTEKLSQKRILNQLTPGKLSPFMEKLWSDKR
jgi:hypothetical protein